MGNLRRHRSTTRAITGVLGIAAAGVIPLVPGSPIAAASLTAADSSELRAAISTLNGSADTFADTITLTSAGPYLLPCGTNEDANADGDLDYTSDDDLTITYAGAGRATIGIDQSGAPCTTERVLDHRGSGTMRLEHIVVSDGNLLGVFGANGRGGGIRMTDASGPTLELFDVLVEDNRSGDGVADAVFTNRAGSNGGGIFGNTGTISVTESVIRANRAGDGADRTPSFGPGSGGSGGGIATASASLTLTDSVVETNRAGDGGAGSTAGAPGRGGDGGGLFVSSTGTLTVGGGRIGGTDAPTGNRAGDGGPDGGWTTDMFSNGTGGSGGGLGGAFDATTTVTGAEIAFNRAGDGSPGTIAEAANGGNGGGISTSGSLVLTDVDVHDNTAGDGGSSNTDTGGLGGWGGGVNVSSTTGTLTIDGGTIRDNVAGVGGASTDGGGGGGGSGGGLVFLGGTATITGVTVDANVAGTGGASTNGIGGSGGSGGGVRVGNRTTTQPAVTMTAVTVESNQAGSGGAGSTPPPGNGAGLYLGNGTIEVFESAVHANTGARFGGGVYAAGGVMHRTVNTTVDANAATSGGGWYSSSGTIEITATTMSDNAAGIGAAITVLNGSTTVTRSVLAGAAFGTCSSNVTGVVDGGYNVEQAAGASQCNITEPTSQVVTDAGLGALQDNGGPTSTRLPGVGSPAVDTILVGDCVESDDQRGVTRPNGSGCDIGAVELDTSITAVADDATEIAAEIVVEVLDNDLVADVPLDPASVTVTNGPTNGTTDVNTTTGDVTYTPTGSFSGIDQFTYRVCLTGLPLDCGAAVVDIDITQPDTTPTSFTFTDVTGVPTSTEQTSNTITVSGINVASPVSVNGGTYSVNGGAFTATAGTVDDGDTVRVRHTSAATPLAATDTTLTVGGVSDTFTSDTAAPDGATRFVPIAPERLFDTRDGTGLDAAGKIAAGGTLDVQVTGRLGIPAEAVAVVMNLTVTAPEAPGFVTAFPRGGTVPNASTLNVTEAGQTRPNLATVPLDDDGYMSAFALMTTHLLGDVAGYYVETEVGVADGRLVPLTPSRIFDTRTAQPANGPKGYVPADGTITVQITGESGVPGTGVSAVVLNVTATQSGGPNFVTVWPTGKPRPTASSLNLFGGETTANLVIVPVGDGGQIDLYSLAGAHLLADVTAYFTDDTAPVGGAGLFVPLDPARLFDTRPAQPAPGPKGYVGAGTSITAQITGVGGVPGDAAAVALNVTATQAPTGFITAWPTGDPLPTASTLNPQGASDTRPNAAILPVGDGGGIDFYALSGAHLLADTTGYFLG